MKNCYIKRHVLFKGVHECCKNLISKVIPLTDYVSPTVYKFVDFANPNQILEYYSSLSFNNLKDDEWYLFEFFYFIVHELSVFGLHTSHFFLKNTMFMFFSSFIYLFIVWGFRY